MSPPDDYSRLSAPGRGAAGLGLAEILGAPADAAQARVPRGYPAPPRASLFAMPQGASGIGDAALELARAALAEVRDGSARQQEAIELAIRAEHDQDFKRFAARFAFATGPEERLAVLWLFRKSELPCDVDEIATALEYVCNFDRFLPANVAAMRFFASLQCFSEGAAAAFARALRVVPQLDPEWAFRSVASAFLIRREHAKVSVEAAISYFNEASVIDGMLAFAVQNFVCIRKHDGAFSDTYASAIVEEAEFIRFVLGVYTDSRLASLDILRKYGSNSKLCLPLIRTYLIHQDAEEPKLTAELVAVVRGKPRFTPVQRFITAPKGSVPHRQVLRHTLEPRAGGSASPASDAAAAAHHVPAGAEVARD